jgi:hypothetical protein
VPAAVAAVGRDEQRHPTRGGTALATADDHGDQPFPADERSVELVALETGSWRELGRRTGGYVLRVAAAPR